MTSSPYHLPTGQLCFPHQCFVQATHNKDHVYKRLNLRVVVGSLGIGRHSPFFEYGGPSCTVVKDFVSSTADPEATLWDAHVWLESEAGEVYDIFTPHMNFVSDQRNPPHDRVGLAVDSVIERKSKSELEEVGLHYVPAPVVVQRVILTKMKRDFGATVTMLREMIALGFPMSCVMVG